MTYCKTSEDQRLLGRFGPLLSISSSSLIQLAAEARHKISGRRPSTKDRHLYRLNSGYNLIHVIGFEDGIKYVIRVPAVGWGVRWTENASNAFRSQALTMRAIKDKTLMPIPEVYDFDTTQRNLIGAPYMMMSFIPGGTVLSKWFEKDGSTTLEERRRKILASVAKAMS
jgi:aminoglycoside phosphotransferase (APT) family kinase protein